MSFTYKAFSMRRWEKRC